MVDPNTPASTKVRAADSILDYAAKAIEIEDIEVRVAALEKATSHTVGLDPGSIDDYWRTSARWPPGMVLETPPTKTDLAGSWRPFAYSVPFRPVDF